MLIHKQLKEIPRRYPEIDIALLHLGGTNLLGILVTMDARQGVEAFKTMNPRMALPIHYDDYSVFASPLEHFQWAVTEDELSQCVHYLRHRDTYDFVVPSRAAIW